MIITASQIKRGGLQSIETEYVVIEEGCLKNFKDILIQNKISGVVAGLFDSNTICAEGMFVPDLDQRIVLDADGLHADEKAVEQTLSQLRCDVEVIAAFGSGTITDIARYCAKQKNLVLVCCPTAASVDGFCSSVCAMTFNGVKVTVPSVAPKIVVADLSVIKNAPKRLVKSGLGDILGKYVSLADWRIAHLIDGEYYSEDIVQLVRGALVSVTDLVKNNVLNGNEFYTQITYALLLSGLAMQFIGSSRPASGAEHHYSHLISVAPPSLGITSNALHGESVGIGTLTLVGHYKNAVARMLKHDGCLQKIITELTKLRQNGNRLYGLDFYCRNFGTLAEQLYRENENDCLASVKENLLQNNWKDVCRVIAEIPSVEQLKSIYIKLGMKTDLSDIGVDENKKELLVRLSPNIRNRLTLNRLLLLTNLV